MDREQNRSFIKGQLQQYLSSKGIDTSKPFHCLNPAHPDKNPSMRYDEKHDKAHCFSCGASYDTLDIIGIDYNLTDSKAIFKKAYEIFTIEAGGRPPMSVSNTQPTKREKQEIEQDYTDFFLKAHKNISKTDYPRERGLSEVVINRFKLGYIKNWRHPKAPETVPTSPRLIIPTGKYSYFARDTRPELTEKEREYSKGYVGKVEIFNKEALETATRPIFITEGQIDALSIIEAGGEAVGLGSVTQANKLLELLKTKPPAQPLIIAMDNDERGKKAAETLKEGLEGLKLPFYTAALYGDEKDANDALRANRGALKDNMAIAEAEARKAAELLEAAGKDEYYKENNAAAYLKEFKDGINASIDTPSTSTGFLKLDEALDGGLYAGLYIVGAISSLGKTTFVTQIADQIARTGQDVLIFSLEMAKAEIMAKSISRNTMELVLKNSEKYGDYRNAKTARGIITGKRYKNYNDKELELINAAISSYEEYAKHIFISEGMGDIGAAQVREMVQQHISFTGNTPVIFIDYLQILAPHNERATDKQNTDKAVLELKRMSRDFKMPVIGISSFNRANYKEAVTMEAFKESGAVEYSSDVLIGLQLSGAGGDKFDANEEKRKNPRNIELVILKNRNGRTGDKLNYQYYPMFNYFEE